MVNRKTLSRLASIGMLGTLVAIVFFIIPIETTTEDRGGGRTVEVQKNLFQVLFEPKVDIEIPTNTEPEACIAIFPPPPECDIDVNDGFQNDYLQDLIGGLYGEE